MVVEQIAIEDLTRLYSQKEIIKDGYYNQIIGATLRALDKQIPAKGKIKADTLTICPTCGQGLCLIIGRERRLNYCWNCGQRIDWSEDNDS